MAPAAVERFVWRRQRDRVIGRYCTARRRRAPPGEVPVWSNADDRSTSCQMLIGVKPEHRAHQANGQCGRGASKRALTGTINGREAVSRLSHAATLVKRGTNPTPVGVARYARAVRPVRVPIARGKRSARAM